MRAQHRVTPRYINLYPQNVNYSLLFSVFSQLVPYRVKFKFLFSESKRQKNNSSGAKISLEKSSGVCYNYHTKRLKKGTEALEYRILGKTGLKISRLGFGGIPIQRIDAEAFK